MKVRSFSVIILTALVFCLPGFELTASECLIPDIPIEYPVKLVGSMADWRAQDYQDSRGITRVWYDVSEECLVLDCSLKKDCPGEALLDLTYLPTMEANVPVDMTNVTITMEVDVPEELVGPQTTPEAWQGLQLFVKDTEWRSQYGAWLNITSSGKKIVSIKPSSEPPDTYTTTDGFRTDRIIVMGIKVAINDLSTHQFQGQIKVTRIEISPELTYSQPVNLPANYPMPHITEEAEVSLESDGFHVGNEEMACLGG